MPISLNIPQHSFITDTRKYKAYISGFGGGKTFAGANACLVHLARHPKIDGAYYAPTYKLIKDVFWPTIDEVALELGFRCKFKVNDKEVHVTRGKAFYGVINCRSLDNPGNIVGYKSGHALIDEIDILPTDKATLCWRKIIARMRYKVPDLRNGVDVTTTPEGYKFIYQKFKKAVDEKPELADHYGLIRASTYDNESNLPDDYIDSLLRDYPEQYIRAYLNGEFVNLTSGVVYTGYDRVKCRSSESIRNGDDIHIGMDFNVNNMSAVIFVKRGEVWHGVEEIVGVKDTTEMRNVIIDRYSMFGKIHIYPDASGKNAHTSSSKSDISILQDTGFSVIVDRSNPRVRDRVLSMNSAFAKGKLKINDSTCRQSADNLEQQIYTQWGEPDKSTGKDHTNDAIGYFCNKVMPIIKPVANIKVTY